MNAPRDQRVAEYAEVDECNRRIDGLVQSLRSRFDDPALEETLSRLIAARARYAAAFIAMADEVEADDLRLARRVYAEQVRPALQDLLAYSNALMRREREHIERRLEQARDQSNRIFFGLVALGVVAMLFAVLLAWRTTRSVVTPLTALEASALRIAQGDYSKTEVLGSEEVVRVQQAVRILADWARTHPQLSIAINISTHDLQDDSLVRQARHLLERHAVVPERLRMEIVETGLMQDPEHSVAMLHALRYLGVQLLVDDFGTGYSSLAYLRRLPVTELKIDRGFISGLDHQLVNQRRGSAPWWNWATAWG